MKVDLEGMKDALVVQGQALNLALSMLVALAAGDPIDDLERHQLEKAAESFRAFTERLRGS